MNNYFPDKNTLETTDGKNNYVSSNSIQANYPDYNTAETVEVVDDNNVEDTNVSDNNSIDSSYNNDILKSDIGSPIFHADVSGDTLSFYNLGVVYVDYMEMKRMFERIREINADMTIGIADLISSLSALASLVDYSLDLDDLGMSSIGLESHFDWNEEENYSRLAGYNEASSGYILGLSDNVSNVLKIMSQQLDSYKKQTEMTDESIRDLNNLVNQVINNQTLTYTTTEGEVITISYNELLNKYKETERKYFQIDGINLYNADGSVNKNSIDALNDLLNNEVANKSGGFMTPEEGNGLTYLQCTWWAQARASQFLGEKCPKFSGNGGNYFNCNKENQWFEYGTEPRPNSLVVYNFSGCGHVGYVEAVDYVNGKIYISDADNGKLFRGVEELDMDGKWFSWYPEGYVYLDLPISNND